MTGVSPTDSSSYWSYDEDDLVGPTMQPPARDLALRGRVTALASQFHMLAKQKHCYEVDSCATFARKTRNLTALALSNAPTIEVQTIAMRVARLGTRVYSLGDPCWRSHCRAFVNSVVEWVDNEEPSMSFHEQCDALGQGTVDWFQESARSYHSRPDDLKRLDREMHLLRPLLAISRSICWEPLLPYLQTLSSHKGWNKRGKDPKALYNRYLVRIKGQVQELATQLPYQEERYQTPGEYLVNQKQYLLQFTSYLRRYPPQSDKQRILAACTAIRVACRDHRAEDLENRRNLADAVQGLLRLIGDRESTHPLLQMHYLYFRQISTALFFLRDPVTEPLQLSPTTTIVPFEAEERESNLFEQLTASLHGHTSPKGGVVADGLCIGGDEIWEAAALLIRNARKRVMLQTYLWYETSESAKFVWEAVDDLQQRLRVERERCPETFEPVEFLIVKDESQGVARQEYPGDGGVLQEFEGLVTLPNRKEGSHYVVGFPFRVDPELIKISVYGKFHKLRGTLHSKTLVVDDRWAMVGSANLKGLGHATAMRGKPCLEVATLVTGDIVEEFVDEFYCALAGCDPMGGNLLETHYSDVGGYQILPEDRPVAPTLTNEEWGALGCSPNPRRPLPDSPELLFSGREVPMLFLRKRAANGVISSPESQQESLNLALRTALQNARECIRILGPSINSERVQKYLIAALHRGVRIEIVLTRGAQDLAEISEKFLRPLNPTLTWETFYSLHRAAVKLGVPHLLNLRWYCDQWGELPSIRKEEGIQHAKYMEIDGVAFIGSANLDRQSIEFSAEVTLVCPDRRVAGEWTRELFTPIWERAMPYPKDDEWEAELVPRGVTPLANRFFSLVAIADHLKRYKREGKLRGTTPIERQLKGSIVALIPLLRFDAREEYHQLLSLHLERVIQYAQEYLTAIQHVNPSTRRVAYYEQLIDLAAAAM